MLKTTLAGSGWSSSAMGRKLREVANDQHASCFFFKFYIFYIFKYILWKLREVASDSHASLLPKATVDPQTEVDQGCLSCTQVTIGTLSESLNRLDTIQLLKGPSFKHMNALHQDRMLGIVFMVQKRQIWPKNEKKRVLTKCTSVLREVPPRPSRSASASFEMCRRVLRDGHCGRFC